VCETVWFFSWVNAHPFDLKLVAFCPKFSGDSYVEFQEKTILGEFFRNFGQTKGYPLPKLVKFRPTFRNFSLRPYCAEKITQVLSYVVCTQVRRHVHKHITKRRYGGEKPGRSVFGKPVLFPLGRGLTTPYSPGILVWNFYQTFVTVSTEFLLRFEPQIRPTRLAINFLFITVMAERRVRLCVKLFDFFRGWMLIRLTWNLSRFVRNSVEILTLNFRKKLFWENFSVILDKPKAILYQNSWNFAVLSEILVCVRIALKKFTQVLSYVVCTQVRRHGHKQITKRRYGGENPGRSVFGKPVLFTLGLGLPTPYSPGILVWNFYQTFVTVSTVFWLRFEPQIRPTRLAINFLFITARAERRVRLCVKLFDFFSGWILIRLTWNLSRFVPNSVEILTWNFRKKLFRENLSEILGKPKAILYQNSWNFALLSEILVWVSIALKKFTQVLSYVFCTQVRRYGHKQITKRRYGREKPGRSVFGKPVLFTLGLGLPTPYSPGILVWNFYKTFVIVSTEFLLRFEP